MKRFWMLQGTLLAAFALGGCPDNTPSTVDDAAVSDAGPGRDGGGDGGVCAGRTLCDAVGTSCDGDALVTCAPDANGCLVETRSACDGVEGGTCASPAGTAMCVVDACAAIPASERCDAESRACDGNTLSVCAPNADGCFVRTDTDCAAAPGGACDASGDMPVCALPADPCASIPAERRCDAEGTSCDGDSLVECAPDAFGCLVTTTTDCTSRTDGTCDASGSAATCAAPDACDGITQCAAAGTACDGPSLVTCAPDAFGCLVETTTDCTDAAFGFCDASGTAQCSTAAVDPCMGVEQCGTEVGRSCSGTSLDVCAPNAFGCFVTTSTDCATDGNVCDASGETPACVDPCTLVPTCAAASYCDANATVTCTADSNGCLVETSRSECGVGTACGVADGVASCVDTVCPAAQTTVIDCSSGTISGNTDSGASSVRDEYCGGASNYAGAEHLYRFINGESARMAVHIVSTRGSGTGDFDLFVLDGGDGTGTCDDTARSCLDSSTGTGATETVDFVGEPGAIEYVAYDIYNNATATTDYTLAVTCTPIVCGDGTAVGDEVCDDGNTTAGDGCSATCTLEAGWTCSGTPSTCVYSCGNGTLNAGEGCDDGNTTAGDGCSATCTVESGYTCSGAGATSCIPLDANGTCATATAITGTTTISGVNARAGGPLFASSTTCGYGTGTATHYYAVTVPAGQRVAVQTTPGLDIVLFTAASCTDTTCLNYTDSSPEQTTLDNSAGTSALTRIVGIRPYSSSGTGTYAVAFNYIVCGDGVAASSEGCDDGNNSSGDGCSATCTVESGYVCSGSPSVCSSGPVNSVCTAGTAITATTTITGENVAGGGALPAATCGGGSGTKSLYYTVSIPANTSVLVTATPTGFDPVLFRVASCTATTCGASADSGGSGTAESMTIANTTASAVTHVVGVRPYSGTTGTFNISFAYAQCGDGATTGTETCDDGNTTSGDGCSATCATESGYACTGTPSVCTQPYTRTSITASCIDMSAVTATSMSGTDDAVTANAALPFSFPYFGTTVTNYSISTNGNIQFFTSSSSTGSTSYSNVTIPNSAVPNGYAGAFWDDLSSVTVKQTTSGENFVVQWAGSVGGTAGVQVQAVVTPAGVIEFHYCGLPATSAGGGSSATIGIENLTGTVGSLAGYNTAGTAVAGSGYRFTPN